MHTLIKMIRQAPQSYFLSPFFLFFFLLVADLR